MVKLVSSYLISLKVAEPMKDVKWRLTVSIWVDNDKSFIFKDGAKLKKKKKSTFLHLHLERFSPRSVTKPPAALPNYSFLLYITRPLFPLLSDIPNAQPIISKSAFSVFIFFDSTPNTLVLKHVNTQTWLGTSWNALQTLSLPCTERLFQGDPNGHKQLTWKSCFSHISR